MFTKLRTLIGRGKAKPTTSPSNTQNAIEDTPNNSDFSSEPIANSPFHMVGHKEKGYFISIGNHRLTEPQPTAAQALAVLEENKWNIISNICIAIYTMMDATRKTN